MNRLILVGNGFDLAHGLKTSYKDFILWYLSKSLFSRGYLPRIHEDRLLQISFEDFNSFNSFFYRSGLGSFAITEKEFNDFVEKCFKEQTIIELLNINDENVSEIVISDNNEFHSTNNYNNRYPFSVHIKSDFLKSLIINCQDCNWVDIENEYFDQLKACKDGGEFEIEKVRQLNSDFSYIRQKLEEYLALQQKQSSVNIIPELLSAIGSKFEISDFEPVMGYEDTKLELGYDKTVGAQITHKLYFLNFNYTNSVQSYLDRLNSINTHFSKTEINYIHGQLDNVDNHIIFGFGDEHDKQYLEFEEHRNNELFKHIKSHQYLQTPNYRNLLNFLNSSNYQVFVMGHSCGLSDRTMFKEIFEHENCKSIRLFHYNGDFNDKVINVSKHFSNKGHMRKLIVNYNPSDTFPQVKESNNIELD